MRDEKYEANKYTRVYPEYTESHGNACYKRMRMWGNNVKVVQNIIMEKIGVTEDI